MKIKELRDYLNSLEDSVLDFEVEFDGLYYVNREEYKSIEIEVIEEEYYKNGTKLTRLPNSEDIKKNRCLYMGAGEFEIGSYESMLVIDDDCKVIDEYEKVIYE